MIIPSRDQERSSAPWRKLWSDGQSGMTSSAYIISLRSKKALISTRRDDSVASSWADHNLHISWNVKVHMLYLYTIMNAFDLSYHLAMITPRTKITILIHISILIRVYTMNDNRILFALFPSKWFEIALFVIGIIAERASGKNSIAQLMYDESKEK